MEPIILVGKRSAGKGVVGDYLSSKYDLGKVVFSEVIKEIGLERGEITYEQLERDRRGTLADWATRLRNVEGNETHTLRAIEKAKEEELYVFDGSRHPDEVKMIKEEFPYSNVLSIDSPLFLRYKRTLEAGRTSGLLHFIRLSLKPSERLISQMMVDADYTIWNNSSLECLYESVDKVVWMMENDIKQPRGYLTCMPRKNMPYPYNFPADGFM